MDRRAGASRSSHAPTRRADVPLVLFALRPRIYSEAIGGVLAELRPGLEVRVVELDDLPTEVGRRTVALVLCSQPRPEGCDAAHWAEYRPYDDPEVVRVDGHDELLPGLRFEDLVGLVDRLAAGRPSGRPSAREAPPPAPKFAPPRPCGPGVEWAGESTKKGRAPKDPARNGAFL